MSVCIVVFAHSTDFFICLTQMNRADYFRKYREANKEYYSEKAKEQYKLRKALYGRQARVRTVVFFKGDPIQKMSIDKRVVQVSFD